MTEQEKQLRAFIGSQVKYDDNGTMIWGGSANDLQLLADVRGWGAIQNLPQFKNDKTQNAAAEFHDALGQFIADAINEKLNNSDRDKFAIEFAEWIDMELWSSEQDGKWICFDDESHKEIKSKQATTIELLNLFKQSKLQGDNNKK